MTYGFLTLAIAIALFVLVSISGAIVNAIARKPVLNWAGWLCWIYASVPVLTCIGLIQRDATSWQIGFGVGSAVGTLLFPWWGAFLYSRRWRRREVA